MIITSNFIGLIVGLLSCNYFLKNSSFAINLFKKTIPDLGIGNIDIAKYIFFLFDLRSFKFRFNSIFKITLFTTIINCLSLPILIFLALEYPDYRSTIISIFPILIGIATVINIVCVDTKFSYISDMVLNDRMIIQEYKDLLFDMLHGKFCAIFLSLFLFMVVYKFIF